MCPIAFCTGPNPPINIDLSLKEQHDQSTSNNKNQDSNTRGNPVNKEEETQEQNRQTSANFGNIRMVFLTERHEIVRLTTTKKYPKKETNTSS